MRVTAQRLAVYRTLAADRSHPTVDTVYARVRAQMPMLSQATVYRILESLESERLVRRVSNTGAVARFDANMSSHQHLVCRMCGRMIDYDGSSLLGTPLPRDPVPGFVIEELDIRLVGRCKACARAGRRSSSPERPGRGPMRRRDRTRNRPPSPRRK